MSKKTTRTVASLADAHGLSHDAVRSAVFAIQAKSWHERRIAINEATALDALGVVLAMATVAREVQDNQPTERG